MELKKRIPTYLQYDEATCTHFSFGSTEASEEVEVVPKQARLTLLSKLKKTMNKPIALLTKKHSNLSKRTSKRSFKFSNSFVEAGRQYLTRKKMERRLTLETRRLEDELKPSGSFRIKGGFVEVSNEYSCVDQFENVESTK